MDQASPDTFQNLSVRITAREKVREAHALADLPFSPRFRSRKLSYPAVPPSPTIAHHTSMTYDKPSVHGYRNADLRG